MESGSNNLSHKLTFVKPKMNEGGMYCVKVKDKKKEHTSQFTLKVNCFVMTGWLVLYLICKGIIASEVEMKGQKRL